LILLASLAGVSPAKQLTLTLSQAVAPAIQKNLQAPFARERVAQSSRARFDAARLNLGSALVHAEDSDYE
jgi:hypothetical protein